jgi:hypothetical protein
MIEMASIFGEARSVSASRPITEVLLRCYWAQEQHSLRRPRQRSPFSPNIFGLDFHDLPMLLDLIHIPALTDIAVAKVSGGLYVSPDTCVTPCLLPSFRHARGFG